LFITNIKTNNITDKKKHTLYGVPKEVPVSLRGPGSKKEIVFVNVVPRGLTGTFTSCI
jgi:hypothetical protein